MLSFVDVNGQGVLDVLLGMMPSIDDEGAEELRIMIDSFCELSVEVDDVSVAAASGCLLVRVCDEREYMLVFPIALTADGNVTGALCELADYARRELIPFRITDIPRDGIELLCSVFPHVNARAYDDDDDTFAAIVMNELDLIEEYPTVEKGGVSISPLTDADADSYAMLCKSREVNRYWGFDDLADNPTADTELFMLIVSRERRDGVSLSLAIRKNGKYLGEAVIYNCDYRGTAEIGIRLLPEYHGNGIGGIVLDALLEYCSLIGISNVIARVMEENLPALKMTERRMREVSREGGAVCFFASVC